MSSTCLRTKGSITLNLKLDTFKTLVASANLRSPKKHKYPCLISTYTYMGVPKLGVPFFLEVPILRTIVFGGLCGGPLILGNYHLELYLYTSYNPLSSPIEPGALRPKALQVCGVDLLYNASSNWLTVIDTSGPFPKMQLQGL